MGFTRKRKTYKLDFADTEYDGLVVKVSGLTTGEYLDFLALSAPVDGEDDKGTTEQMLRMLADHIVSWNLLDEQGNPIPTDFEGIKSNEIAMNMMIVEAWTDAIANVPADTGKASTPGSAPLVASIPTEML